MSDNKKTMVRALKCLAIATPEDVQKDVAAKVRAYTDELEAERDRLAEQVVTQEHTIGIAIEERCEFQYQRDKLKTLLREALEALHDLDNGDNPVLAAQIYGIEKALKKGGEG